MSGGPQKGRRMERAREWRRVTAEMVVSEILSRFPAVGSILLQHGRMFHARKGELYVSYPPLTVAEYASRSEIDLELLLRLLNAAAETDEFAHRSHGSHRPGERRPDLIGRGTAVGYTGAYREPGSVDIQDVVALQTARGPE